MAPLHEGTPRIATHVDISDETRRALHSMRNALAALLGHVEAAGIEDAGRVAKIRERGRELKRLIAELETSERNPMAATLPDRIDAATTKATAPASSTSERRPVEPGAVIDGVYHVLEEIGRGGMGTVLRVHDLHLDRMVALKLLRPEGWDGTDAQRVFLREARAMASVHHPNVVAVHAFGTASAGPYFVMELIEGTDLEKMIRRQRGPMDVDDTIAILEQVCRGVSAIHAEGVVHRDLKPGNILIGPVFRVAVTDFGLTARTGGALHSVNGGTPGYMAPEVIGMAVPPDPRADVYALGVIAREMLTGERVFPGKSTREIVDHQLEGAPPFSLEPGRGPGDLVGVIERAMAMGRDDRYPTADAFRMALHRARSRWKRDYGGTRVHVVDDDPGVLELLEHTVTEALPEAAVRAFTRAEDSSAAAKQNSPDLAIVDLDMPGMNGVELTGVLRSLDPSTRVIVVTGVGGAEDWKLLQRMGASAFLVKPFEPATLTALVRRQALPRTALD